MDGEGQEQGFLMIALPTLPLAHELALPAVFEALSLQFEFSDILFESVQW